MEYNITVGKFGSFYVNPGTKGDGLDEHDKASLTSFTTIYTAQNPVMQYTDLKDRNGTEIYEGDIWENQIHKFQVKIGPYEDEHGAEHYGAYVELIEEAGIAGGEIYSLPPSTQGIVIGNIYENPELLSV